MVKNLKARKKPKPTRIRDLEKTRRDILDAAFMEVFTRGFQGVSVDDIVKKTTHTKGAFYHYFPTKLDLGYALVDEVIKPMIIDRWISPLDTLQDPLAGILNQIKVLIDGAAPEELQLGCPLNNLVQEMAPIDAGFRDRLQVALLLWIDETNRHLQRAKKAGFIRADVDTRSAAYFIVMAHEGFYGMLKGLRDPRAFEALYESLDRFFQSISATPVHEEPLGASHCCHS
ncbi:MAG TPA: TetR/AcrR family transcriptional regulator [Oligoflexus sp.]|nr:TetR/AcrR family transcriptional regulator [Oligoflexus sp.]